MFTKLMIVALVTLSMAMLVSTAEATNGGTVEAYPGCLQACQENYETICEPAVIAEGNGKIPHENVEPMCHCGVLVCANSCVRESGYPEQAQALPQICAELGVVE